MREGDVSYPLREKIDKMVADGYQPISILPAYHDTENKQFMVWCSECRIYHIHGALDGSRSSHCHDKSSKYENGGYILKKVGFWTDSLEKDSNRKRPKGPASMGYIEKAIGLCWVPKGGYFSDSIVEIFLGESENI